MKETKIMKPVIFTVAIIAGVTAAFMGLTQIIVKAEYNRINKIYTSYNVADIAANTNHRPVPEGYIKANYTVIDSVFGSETPTAKDIPRDEAAETGIQALYELYQLDMEGKTIDMSYYSGGNGMRAQWLGTYWINGGGDYTNAYSFSVDSITGELLTVEYNRFPSSEKPVDEGLNIETDEISRVYEALAINYAEKFNIITGAIEKAEYHSQNTSNGNIIVNLYVYGQNGERAFLAIDSNDDVLIGVAYNAGCLQLDELERWYEEVQKEQ